MKYRVRAMEKRKGVWDTVYTKNLDDENEAKSTFYDLAVEHECTFNKDKWYAYSDKYTVEFIRYDK